MILITVQTILQVYVKFYNDSFNINFNNRNDNINKILLTGNNKANLEFIIMPSKY